MLLGTSVYGATVLPTFQGGTGTSSPYGIQYGDNNSTNHLNTVTIGSGLSFIAGTLSSTGTGFGEAWQLISNIFSQSALAPTTTQNIAVNGTGTSTFAGGVEAWRAIGAPYFNATSSATSTFAGGIKTNLLNVISTSASSTFGNGINLANGCFSIGNVCIGNGAGTVTSVTGTWPIISSGGAIPNITFGWATTSQPSSSNLFVSNGTNGFYGIGTSTLTATSPLTGSFVQIGSGGALGCQTASGSQAGCLSSSDWTTFNSKGSGTITAVNPGTGLTGGGSSGSITLTNQFATSSGETTGQLAYWTTTNGVPAKLGKVATTSETCTSPIICTAHDVLTGGGAITLGTVTVANGGTNKTSYPINSIITSDSAGTSLIATTSQLTTGSIIATSTITNSFFLNNLVGFGTSTMAWPVTIASSTVPQLALSSGTGIAQWAMRNAGGNLYYSTTTVAGTATSSVSAFTVLSTGGVGINTNTPNHGGFGGGGILTVDGDGSNSSVFELFRPISAGALNVGNTTFGDTSNSVLARFGATTGSSGSQGRLFFSTSNGSSLLEGFRVTEDQLLTIGTTTSAVNEKVTIATTTGQHLAFSAGAGIIEWAMRNAGGNFYLSTTTVDGTATSTIPLFAIETGSNGVSTTTIANADFRIKTGSTNAFSILDNFNTQDLLMNTSSTTGSIFTVAATSSPSLLLPIKLFDVDQYGHITASSTRATPTISCSPSGGTIAANSNDVTGDFTTGTLSTACTITFGSVYSATPEVLITGGSTASVVAVTSRSTTAFTVGLGTALTGDNISYLVIMP